MVGIICAGLACGLAWDSGVSTMASRAGKHATTPDILGDIRAISDSLQILTWPIFLAFFLLNGYLTFLGILPLLIEKKPPSGKPDDKG